jgi:hypothetical protein
MVTSCPTASRWRGWAACAILEQGPWIYLHFRILGGQHCLISAWDISRHPTDTRTFLRRTRSRCSTDLEWCCCSQGQLRRLTRYRRATRWWEDWHGCLDPPPNCFGQLHVIQCQLQEEFKIGTRTASQPLVPYDMWGNRLNEGLLLNINEKNINRQMQISSSDARLVRRTRWKMSSCSSRLQTSHYIYTRIKITRNMYLSYKLQQNIGFYV